MVFTSWGGTTQEAQKKAWVDPFATTSGITVKEDGPTDYGKLKAMVESGNVDWDVVDVEGSPSELQIWNGVADWTIPWKNW